MTRNCNLSRFSALQRFVTVIAARSARAIGLVSRLAVAFALAWVGGAAFRAQAGISNRPDLIAKSLADEDLIGIVAYPVNAGSANMVFHEARLTYVEPEESYRLYFAGEEEGIELPLKDVVVGRTQEVIGGTANPIDVMQWVNTPASGRLLQILIRAFTEESITKIPKPPPGTLLMEPSRAGLRLVGADGPYMTGSFYSMADVKAGRFERAFSMVEQAAEKGLIKFITFESAREADCDALLAETLVHVKR